VAKPFYHLRRNVEFVLTRGDNRLSRGANAHRRAISRERRKEVLETIGSPAVIPVADAPRRARGSMDKARHGIHSVCRSKS
jgi:hypothetical protein